MVVLLPVGQFTTILWVLCLPSIVNPRRACAARVIVLGLSVCLYVCLLPLHLPSRTAIRHENDITYQADREDQFNRTVFSENAALRRSSGVALASTWPFLQNHREISNNNMQCSPPFDYNDAEKAHVFWNATYLSCISSSCKANLA